VENKTYIEEIKALYLKSFNKEADRIAALPISGSSRQYYRISHQQESIIGVYNEDIKENNAFLEFTKCFCKTGLAVPEILAVSEDQTIYLQSDLGDTTLFQELNKHRSGDQMPAKVLDIYKKVLQELPRFQIEGDQCIDYQNCYPRAYFDRQSMMWDLNYFKYYFLKLAGVVFDEQKLEDDFTSFTDFLLTAKSDYFLYRDFQSRNIMIKDGEPYFIDYQGGRKGALQYDLASLLYDSKANLPEETRLELLEYYIKELEKYQSVDKEEFRNHFYGFVLIRMMQAMGAYGYRGFFEKKELFLKSIPFALKNLKHLLNTVQLPIEIPTLWELFHKLVNNEKLLNIQNETKLKVRINSFSFKKGIPNDLSGNGGGFVFDCRYLPNPGRYKEYKTSSGLDQNVITFLEKEQEVAEYLEHALFMVEKAVKRYMDRNFTNLMVSFGCTGGQHRSVYLSERTAAYLKSKYDIHIELNHFEKNNWPHE